jgi:hypothetical protein
LLARIFQIGGRVIGIDNDNLTANFFYLADVTVANVAFPFHASREIALDILPVCSAHKELMCGARVFDNEARESGISRE